MALNSYDLLKTAVANWLERSDLTDRVPEFITLAESRIARRLRIRSMESRDTSITTVAGTEYYTLPTDFLEARNVQLNLDPIRVLKYRTPQQLDREYSSNSTGEPCVFSIIGTEIQLRPIPESATVLEIAYFGKLPALSASNTTNWFTTNAPDLILYGALLEASAFLVDDARVPGWKALFDQSIAEWNQADEKGRYSGSHLEQRTTTGNP